MSTPSAELPQEVIGPYRIVSVLGRGASAVTYLAESQIGRRVALKVSHHQDPAAATRLLREARALAKLDHPNIGKLVDYGATENSTYLAYEYVEGSSLERLLHQGRKFSVTEVLAILSGIAGALTTAHSQAILHRDLKPSNVFLAAPTDTIRLSSVRLIDFGVFGQLQSTSLTVSGQVFGTPLYMSPEQVKGLPQSPAADIYGLALVGYELLFGKLPFDATDVMGLLVEKLQAEIRVPSAANVPEALRQLLDDCLRLDPAKRPASAAEVATRLSVIQGTIAAGAMESTHLAPSAPTPATTRVAAGQPSSGAGSVPAPRSRIFVAALAIAILLSAAVAWLVLRPATPHAAPGGNGGQPIFWGPIILGFGAAALMIAFGTALRRRLAHTAEARRSQAGAEVAGLLTHSRNRQQLTRTIAIQIDQLIDSCRRSDERIIASTVAAMIGEYESGKTSGDRQAALMNSIVLLEKLSTRLSPWYVRNEKLIGFVISFLTILSGLASVALGIMKVIGLRP